MANTVPFRSHNDFNQLYTRTCVAETSELDFHSKVKLECKAWRFAKRFFHFEVTPMNAVIKTGGKQYRVAPGLKLKVEQIPAEIGQEIKLDQVLSVGEGEQLQIGAPLVEGAVVTATVLAQGRHDKVKIFKMRRRKHYQKRQGHRQNYTELLIQDISA